MNKIKELTQEAIISSVALALSMKDNGKDNGEILKTICKVYGGHETVEAGDDEGLTNSYCVICNQKI